MLQYIFKRFLLSLPALWLLVTLVFLLSRLLTGTPGEEQILQDGGGFYSKGSTASREKAYISYLERTGQNLPLFYFTIKATPEPDTLHLVHPEAHRTFLKQLHWQYGNPVAVNRYFTSIKNLEQALGTAHKNHFQPYFESLYQTTSPEIIKQALASFPKVVSNASINTEVAEWEAAGENLIQEQNTYTYLLPSFRWHGTANQYHIWFINALQGDMGISFRDSRPVNTILYDAMANTWWLILISIIVAFMISFELGMLLAMPQSIKLRKLLLPSLFIIDSIPLFLLALLLLVLLATPSFLQLFPVFGLGYHTMQGGSWLQRIGILSQYMALPAICLTLSNIPYLTSLIYRSFSEESKKDYARTAKAKGFSERQVIRTQLLRNTLLPTITVLSEALPALVAGAIVVETIFAIPGMGRLLVDAVLARDYPVIVAIVLVVAVFRVVLYLLADVGYSLADPRIRHAAS
ncbi:peptide/nickel transport system permease protein [Pontibacter aydingkolensis]|uniref:ABC transporter permease n=1 Tax=Pontibacter aydingkolensis TaxID=1911536 RepID=A0ABS7CWV2_9BACT|nr:ABC transporter permease [Pontibacter aydingkolensis]MBW7467982.1 ABC transporter permease [Pontibacter aydingkolensis]